MGYDMHTVIKPEGEERAVARVREQFDAAVKVRNNTDSAHAQAEVERLYNLLYKTKRSYFRANISGMGRLREAMLISGMAYESNPDEAGAWPTTIPLHKFGSNDGWIVTPAEILEALAAWHSLSAGERDDALQAAEIIGEQWELRWKEWLAFLELATHCNGFEVH